MVFFLVAWLVAAAVLVAVDIWGRVRGTNDGRGRWGSAMIWAFALSLFVFAAFWFSY